MREIHDAARWHEACLEGAIDVDPDVYAAVRSKPGAHPDDLLDECGVRLKAGFDAAKRGFRFLGKLVKFDATTDEVVVRSTIDQETFWVGTVEQYHRMWCTD
jgi:hypothetical protein